MLRVFLILIRRIFPLPPLFYGTEVENPNSHLRNFEAWHRSCFGGEACTDRTYLRCFPYSLRDYARVWFDSLSLSSFPTWLLFQAEFLRIFFPPFQRQRQGIRVQISQIMSFSQFEGEFFHQAWDRFRDMVLGCPHHGFDMLTLIRVLFRWFAPLGAAVRRGVD